MPGRTGRGQKLGAAIEGRRSPNALFGSSWGFPPDREDQRRVRSDLGVNRQFPSGNSTKAAPEVGARCDGGGVRCSTGSRSSVASVEDASFAASLAGSLNERHDLGELDQLS